MGESESLLTRLKRTLYFPIANYFKLFAGLKLLRWKPRIIVITGSSGKTTTFEMIKSQLGNQAFYSDHANSSYGIPFNILGLSRKTLAPSEWILLFLKTPFLSFSKVPKQKIYVVEADCDRPGEGRFLADFLDPEVTIWLSSQRTHSMNFDSLVAEKKFNNVEEAIAREYGCFLERTGKLAIVNSDSELIEKQLSRTKSEIVKISDKDLTEFTVSKSGSSFKIKDEIYKFDSLLPRASFQSILASIVLTDYLGFPANGFSDFKLPPGRSSIFKGIKNITLVDSSYNSNLGSATEIIKMFNMIDSGKKWAVIGDMLEQGKQEREEHEKLAKLLAESNYERVVLLGPRIIKYGYPILEKHYKDNVISYTSPKDVLNYLLNNLEGGETILFKGARFMEGVIENLLSDKDDVKRLARREKIWETRRKKWGL